MSEIFNTPFENSIRVLLLLSEYKGQAFTLDRITAVDFITINSKLLTSKNGNLNGDNSFAICEYSNKRDMINKAIKMLVVRGLIDVKMQINGLCYSINENGQSVVTDIKTNYAEDYKSALKANKNLVKNKKDEDLITFINKKISGLMESKNG